MVVFDFPGPGDGLLRVLRTDHPVAQILKHMLADFKDGGIVFNQQYGFPFSKWSF
jgi:hypothetical protein